MFIEKCLIVEKAMDEPVALTEDVAKYDVVITCAEGIAI